MNWFKKKRIFLDYASATPLLPEVKKVMERYWSKDFYNASGIYEESLLVKKKIEESRTSVARTLGLTSSGIVFTASGTESDNLAILGAFESARKSIKKPHIIVSAIEHPAVMSSALEVERRGGELSILDVDEYGKVSPEALRKLLKENTFLVSIGLANNEIGIIEPLAKVGRIIREYRKNNESEYPYLHSDASQAPSYLSLNLESLQTDLMTLDGAKIYGPKGIGVLALRKSVKIHPVIFGGGQEGSRRSGTLSPSLVSGFALALHIAQKDMEKESRRLETLRKYFIEEIERRLPSAVINGFKDKSLPNIVSVSLPNTLSEFVLLKLDKEGVMASPGSVCSLDGITSGSSVIRALGKSELAESTIRFSFGRPTTKKDIEKALNIFCRIAKPVLK